MSTAQLRATYNAAARARGRRIGRRRKSRNPARVRGCKRNLLAFLRRYLSARFPLPFSQDHLRLIALLQKAILFGGLQSVAMPRGSGKTTIFEGAALWAIIYGHRRFVMVVAGDQEKADALVASIKSELAHNDLLAEDFPDACIPIRKLEGIARRAEGQEWEGEPYDPPRKDDEGKPLEPPGIPTLLVWTGEEVRLAAQASGGGSVIRAVGITGGIRGAKAAMADGSQQRPDLVLVDDPQTDSSARSPSQVALRLRAITSTILGLAGPGEAIACLVAVTVIEPGDLAEQILDRTTHPEWQGFRCRMMNAMPSSAAMVLWDRYTEILREDLRQELGKARATAFYRANRAAMDEGADAAWPERREADEISAVQHAMTIRAVRGTAAFCSEYQNEPENLMASLDLEQLTAPAILRKLNGHDRGVVPDGDSRLTAGIDIQEAALYWAIAAWAEDFSGDVTTYGTHPDQGRAYFRVREIEKTMEKIHGGASWEAALYAALGALVGQIAGREFPTDGGAVMKVERIVIDAGYGRSTDTVYKFCRASPYAAILTPYFGRTIAAGAKPMDEYTKKPGDRVGPSWRMAKPTARTTRHVIADANWWKSFVAARLLTKAADAGCLSVFGRNPSEHRMFADQLAAEVCTRVSANGRTSDEWRLKPNQDNHFFDCLIMAAVGASIQGVRLDVQAVTRRAAALVLADGASSPNPDPTPTPPPPPPRPSGGLLSGFGRRRLI